MSQGKADVVIIGGGVIGAACAHYLALAGRHVTIVDRGGFGSGCSHANCGFVCPSHVLPLTVPGAVGKAIQSIFQSNAPFAIKPRFDPGLWAWLIRFARRCNVADMMSAGRAIHALLKSSRALYDELIAQEHLDCEWEARGLVFVFRSPAAMDHYAHTDRLLLESFGVGATRYDPTGLEALEPSLKPGLAGAWHYEGDAHLRPDRLMSTWKAALEARGVTIRESCEVRGFVREGGRARAVLTATGELAGEEFVVAAGAWAPLLQKHLGCRLPIQPGKGYSITMPRPTKCPTRPLIFEEHHVAITPMASGYRIGSTMEFAGYDSSVPPQRLELLRKGASHYLQEPFREPVQEEWYGWRPMTYDGVPIIDRCPGLTNLVIAAGHNMLGLSMAPATGKLVAELLSDTPPHLDLFPYRIARFG